MTFIYIILACAAIALLLVALRDLKRRKAVEQLRNTPLRGEWVEILEANVPIYQRLPADLRSKLHRYIQVFLATKSFEACGEIGEVTDEMRLLVAAQACLLLLNGRNGCFDALESVLLYPNAYKARESLYGGTDHDEEHHIRLGESWGTGSIVLSWHHVRHGASNDEDGHNVVIHEFAHQLDQIDGWADGLPILKKRSLYPEWQRIFSAAYERHVQRTEDGRRTVIDSYGATNPAEFFAVATETFFEKPRVLHKKYPELYGQLARFYAVDPLSWD